LLSGLLVFVGRSFGFLTCGSCGFGGLFFGSGSCSVGGGFLSFDGCGFSVLPFDGCGVGCALAVEDVFDFGLLSFGLLSFRSRRFAVLLPLRGLTFCCLGFVSLSLLSIRGLLLLSIRGLLLLSIRGLLLLSIRGLLLLSIRGLLLLNLRCLSLLSFGGVVLLCLSGLTLLCFSSLTLLCFSRLAFLCFGGLSFGCLTLLILLVLSSSKIQPVARDAAAGTTKSQPSNRQLTTLGKRCTCSNRTLRYKSIYVHCLAEDCGRATYRPPAIWQLHCRHIRDGQKGDNSFGSETHDGKVYEDRLPSRLSDYKNK
jgi:hypothetical protein